MQDLTLRFCPEGAAEEHSLHVPDITTALVVAQINADDGSAEIREGERLVATLEKRGHSQAPFWVVS